MSTLTVNGFVSNLETGASFRDVVIDAARNAGYGKFRVYLDGVEIDPANAPATVPEGSNLEVRPFEKAGWERV